MGETLHHAVGKHKNAFFARGYIPANIMGATSNSQALPNEWHITGITEGLGVKELGMVDTTCSWRGATGIEMNSPRCINRLFLSKWSPLLRTIPFGFLPVLLGGRELQVVSPHPTELFYSEQKQSVVPAPVRCVNWQGPTSTHACYVLGPLQWKTHKHLS